MTSTAQQALKPRRGAILRSWRAAVGLTAIAGAAAVVAGVLLPWAEAFAGLISIPGIRGSNGKIMLALAAILALAGLVHLARGDTRSRWAIGLTGFVILVFSGYLLLRLSTTVRALSGSMDLVRGGPGLWVIAGGSLAAFATFFLPASDQRTFALRPAAGAGLVAWAGDRRSAGPRRWLQLALGAAWLLDAALQYQPFMFSRGFAAAIIEPAGMGSPAFVSTPVMSYGSLIEHSPVLTNAAFATIQLALAAGLFWRPAVRAALAGSVAWGLGVWWVGEGMGMLFSGTASPLTGAPGAALLYALIAVLAWPRRQQAGDPGPGRSVAGRGPLGRRFAQIAWLAVWGSGAVLLLQSSSLASGALRASSAGLAAGEPGWIAAMDRGAAAAAGSGTAVTITLAVIFAIIAAGIFVPVAVRPVLILAAITALAVWVLGENFGAIATGQGTDPNTGPLLVLLACAYWPRTAAAREPSRPAAAAGRGDAVPAGPVAAGPAPAAAGLRP